MDDPPVEEASSPPSPPQILRRKPSAPVEPATPHSEDELRRALRSPLKGMEVVLAESNRLAVGVASGRHQGLLVLLLLTTSVLFALPYGAVLDLERFWQVAALFVGSLAICFPSLQVFGNYMGFRIDVTRNLSLALFLTSAAALFSFGFFPILWFLQETMQSDGGEVTAQHISIVFLTLSLAAGIGHLGRCLVGLEKVNGAESSWLLMLVWQVLFVFITYRMALVLEIL